MGNPTEAASYGCAYVTLKSATSNAEFVPARYAVVTGTQYLTKYSVPESPLHSAAVEPAVEEGGTVDAWLKLQVFCCIVYRSSRRQYPVVGAGFSFRCMWTREPPQGASSGFGYPPFLPFRVPCAILSLPQLIGLGKPEAIEAGKLVGLVVRLLSHPLLEHPARLSRNLP